MPLFGPPNVEKMSAKSDKYGLIKAVNYQKDVQIRREACRALAKEIRWEIAFEHELAIGALTTGALNDPDNQVRLAAIESLGELFGSRNLLLISNLAKIAKSDNNSQMQAAAISALANCALKFGRDKAYADQYEAAATAILNFGPVAADPLIEKLKNLENGSHVQQNCHSIIAILVKLGVTVVEPLKEIIQNPPAVKYSWTLVESAIEGLGSIKTAESADILASVLQGKSYTQAAALALGELGDPRAVKFLLPMLQHHGASDRDKYEMISAAKALGHFKDARATERLLDIAINEEIYINIRDAAHEAIVQSGDTRAVRLLVKWFESESDTLDGRIESAQRLLTKLLTVQAEHIDTADLQTVTHLKDGPRNVTRSRRDQLDDTEHYKAVATLNNLSSRKLASQELLRRGVSAPTN